MAIKVKFFASLREQVTNPKNVVDGAQVKTVEDVWNQATDAPMPAHVLCSVNFEHQESTASVSDGDEVGFFPPITGG